MNEQPRLFNGSLAWDNNEVPNDAFTVEKPADEPYEAPAPILLNYVQLELGDE